MVESFVLHVLQFLTRGLDFLLETADTGQELSELTEFHGTNFVSWTDLK